MERNPNKPGPLEEFHGQPIFHLAFAVTDIDAAIGFYVDVLGCRLGRQSDNWVDFNFFGYQITAHRVEDCLPANTNIVDGHEIPVPHFGLIMTWEDWHRAVDHMNYIGVTFKVAPHIRFENQPGEQATFLLADPSGNCLEFKAFKNKADVFRTA